MLSVLTGRLSLVGPRPAIWNSDEPDLRALWLTAVKPGVTGPWRLSGRDASLVEQTVRDLTYIRNYSIWEDVRIVSESIRRLKYGHLQTLLGRWEASGAHDSHSARLMENQDS